MLVVIHDERPHAGYCGQKCASNQRRDAIHVRQAGDKNTDQKKDCDAEKLQ